MPDASGSTVALQRALDVFLQYLVAEGAHVVFGVPGGLLHPFFEGVERHPQLRLVVTKHEEGAAFMADGYARTTRKLAVCAGTAGPGATNLLTGVSCAFADGVPMLVLTGQVPSHAIGRGAAQETAATDMDIVGMFKPVTKYSAAVESPERLAQHLRRALRLALTGRPGPVHLNVPVDFWSKPADEIWFDPKTYRPTTHLFDRTAVAAAAEKLLRAKKPTLLVGSGAVTSGAEEHVQTLAELLQARVATSPRAKGALAEDHPLSLGVLGFAGHKQARQTLLGTDVDCLFTIGASLNETTTFNWNPSLRTGKTLIQLDIDADRIGRSYPVDVALVGDAQTILVELVYHIHRAIREGASPGSEWSNEPPLVRGHERYDQPALRTSDAIPLTPQRWRADLQEALPEDAIVFSDIGGHMLFNIHELCVKKGQKFVINLGFGSMGHGTCAPIGAALASKRAVAGSAEGGTARTRVISIIGDACFTMNGMELITAAEYRVPVVWIVENNQMHGITWHGSKLVSGGRPMESIRYQRPLEIAAIARAMGLPAWVVDRPQQMQQVLSEALSMGAPALIEVRVDGSISPPLGDRAKTVAGFKGHET